MKIEAGMKCKQTKVIEKYGFDFVGKEFEITKVDENVIMGRSVDSNVMGVGFGIEPGEFENYFELIEDIGKVDKAKENKETTINEVYTYEELPYKVNWKITNNDEVTYKTVESEDFSFRLIINGNATIIILNDGSKGVARCMPGDKYDANKGFYLAYYRAMVKSYGRKIKEMLK